MWLFNRSRDVESRTDVLPAVSSISTTVWWRFYLELSRSHRWFVHCAKRILFPLPFEFLPESLNWASPRQNAVSWYHGRNTSSSFSAEKTRHDFELLAMFCHVSERQIYDFKRGCLSHKLRELVGENHQAFQAYNKRTCRFRKLALYPARSISWSECVPYCELATACTVISTDGL